VGLFSRLFKTEEPAPQAEEAWAFPFQGYGTDFHHINPSELLWKKGPAIFSKMRRDAQVKASYEFKLNAIISLPWSFEIENDDPRQEGAKEFFTQMLEQKFKGTFQFGLRAVLDSMRTGFSITEKIFDVVDFNGSPKWGLVGLKLRPFETFEFKVDDFGNVIELLQEQDGAEVPLDPEKFIHFVNLPESDPVFGESDLETVHPPWFRKTMYKKYEAIYLERMGAGFVKGTSEGAMTGAGQAALLDIVKNIASRSGVALPKGYDVDLKFPPTGGTAFKETIEAENKEISKALLVPNLLGVSEQGSVGSNAQAEVQFEAFFLSITAIANALADKMNEEVFKPLTLWNFGDVKTPAFKFDTMSAKQKKEMANSWKEAVEGQIVLNTPEDEDRTRTLLNYPARDTEQEPLPSPEQPEEEPDLSPESEERREFQAQPAFERRTDIRQIEAFFNAERVSMTRAMTEATNAIFDDLMMQSEPLAGTGPSHEIDQLAIPPALKRRLNSAIATGISNSFNMGQGEARQELQSALATSDNRLNLTRKESLARGIGRTTGAVQKRDQETGEFIEGLPPQTAEEFFQSKSFTITGDISNDILSEVKRTLNESIKEGESIDEIRDKLEETLKPLVGQKDSAGRVINVPARIETIARTNITESFNEARLSTFTDPELGGFVVAMEYSAVIDSKTTDFCRTMDGRIYRMESGMWSSPGGARRVPPAHFNCRSILIPVTEVDEFTESPPVPQSVQPATGFGAAAPTQEA
jgi:SPP1 gp7 family putative phage head morphogenesis protein